jgi:hypothetical protein
MNPNSYMEHEKPDSLIRFAQIFCSEIILTLLSVTRGALLIILRKYENQAWVHFMPNLKVGVFVTLRAPDVIKNSYVFSSSD